MCSFYYKNQIYTSAFTIIISDEYDHSFWAYKCGWMHALDRQTDLTRIKKNFIIK